jgi:hypothetical protein
MVVSASFTRQLFEFTEQHLGKTGFKILIGSVLVGAASAFFINELKRLAHPLRVAGMLAILLLTLFYLWKIELPQVRMHILMYAVVGWRAGRDAMKAGRSWKNIGIAWVFASVAGAMEELFQKILPYRFFEVSDIVFNTAGATLGVVLYLLRPKQTMASGNLKYIRA